jgi:hypothetical protein
MRYLVVAAAFVCAAFSGAIADEDKALAGGSAADKVVLHEAGGSGGSAVDTGPVSDGGPSSPDSFEYGSGQRALMPMADSEDPNTGMPNKVPSDSYGEFD